MRGRSALALRLSPILLLAALAACGGTKTVTVTETETVTVTVPSPLRLRVYFFRDGKLAPFAREVRRTGAPAAAALATLLEGFTAVEGSSPRLTNAAPKDGGFGGLRIDDGVASLELRGDWRRPALAQLVYTLTQFGSVKAVQLAGERYTRASFEDLTPPILVESPLPGEAVRSPLHATGTANTFEATFEYELTDPDGKIVASHFVTATSGSGTRGTFDFTVPFSVERGGLGELTVFERSAEDGSRIHLVEIPVRLER